MHSFGRTDDGVHRARGDAQGATDAAALIDDGKGQGELDAVGRVQRQRRSMQQRRERFDAGCAARRALIDFGFTRCDRFGIRSAAFLAAFRALRLR